MSSSSDEQRKEDAVERRVEAAKARLAFAGLVLAAYTDGEPVSATAARLGRSERHVQRVRTWLGVSTGRAWRTKGQRTGRQDSATAITRLMVPGLPLLGSALPSTNAPKLRAQVASQVASAQKR